MSVEPVRVVTLVESDTIYLTNVPSKIRTQFVTVMLHGDRTLSGSVLHGRLMK